MRFAVPVAVAALVPLLVPAANATAVARHPRLPAAEAAAVRYAVQHGMTTGIAVVDTKTGRVYAAGKADHFFQSASVVKTLIATRLILRGKLHGDNRALAYRMITQSDNDAASALYPKAGGDRLVPRLAHHYGVPDLGRPTTTTGEMRWGATKLTARGMAKLYAAIRQDPLVWPWLSRTMHAYQRYSSAGEPNAWGLAAASPHAAVKNGWVLDGDPLRAQINTTGFVDHDRFTVAIFSRGPTSLYYRGGEAIVSAEAELIAPHGHVRVR